MTTNILLGVTTMLFCLLLQLMLLVAAVRFYRKREDLILNPSFMASMAVLAGIMVLLLIGNLAQIAIWAALFCQLEEFSLFSAAFYHSAVNFATLGYGDVVMSDAHKLLGPLEAVNGVLMIGISTAALMGAMQDAVGKTIEARQDRKS